MKRKLLIYFTIILISIITLKCRSSNELEIGLVKCGVPWVGWAGPPENPSEKPYEYFYDKTSGRASKLSITKKDGKLMKTTCKESPLKNAKEDLIAKMLGESICNSTPEYCNETLGKSIILEYKNTIKDYKIKECKPIAVLDPTISLSEWRECQCVIYIHFPGGRNKIIARAKEIENEKRTHK